MKKRNKIVAAIILVVVVGLVVVYTSSINTTFSEEVTDHFNLKDVSSIEIIKTTSSTNEDTVTVTDPKQMELIMNTFSMTKLRKDPVENSNYTDSYWITIKNNGTRQFGLTLYGHNYLEIYNNNATKNALKSYKIKNELDLTLIQSLFK